MGTEFQNNAHKQNNYDKYRYTRLIIRQLGAPGQASAKNNVESSTLQSPAQGRQNVIS